MIFEKNFLSETFKWSTYLALWQQQLITGLMYRNLSKSTCSKENVGHTRSLHSFGFRKLVFVPIVWETILWHICFSRVLHRAYSVGSDDTWLQWLTTGLEKWLCNEISKRSIDQDVWWLWKQNSNSNYTFLFHLTISPSALFPYSYSDCCAKIRSSPRFTKGHIPQRVFLSIT